MLHAGWLANGDIARKDEIGNTKRNVGSIPELRNKRFSLNFILEKCSDDRDEQVGSDDEAKLCGRRSGEIELKSDILPLGEAGLKPLKPPRPLRGRASVL
jgi:hypothetical protein